MKRGSEQSHAQWAHVFVVLVAVALAGYLSGGDTTGAVVYRDANYGYGGGEGYFFGDFFGGFSFTEFYDYYGFFVDAVLFLIIFLSLGRAVLGRHFDRGGRSLYIGVGVFLAFALLLWEEQTGIFVLREMGIFSLILLIVFVLIVIHNALRAGGINPFVTIPIMYLIFMGIYYLLLWEWFQETSIFQWLSQGQIDAWLLLGAIVAILMFIGGLIWGRGDDHRDRYGYGRRRPYF